MGIIIKLPGITRKWPGIIIIFGGGHGNTLVYFGIMITNSAKLGIIKVISPQTIFTLYIHTHTDVS